MIKKHILIILCVFSSIFLLVQIMYTYSLFETEQETVVASPIAKWNVLVNQTLLSDFGGQTNSFNLGSIHWDSGGHVREEKAAPGSVGTFEIEIDPTNTEVSFLYELEIDTSQLGNDQISIMNISEEDGHEFVRTEEFKYVGIARYADISNGDKYHIKIDMIWNNDEENNKSDYELGQKAEEKVSIPVSLKMTQYVGDEEITPYDSGD